MRIITYADKYYHRNIEILKSKIDIETLPAVREGFRLYHKFLAVYKYIEKLPDNEIIVFVDAFDVLPVNKVNKDRLEYAITSTFNLEKITFNAEKLCWPNPNLAKYFNHIPGEWKYLNSGMYVAKVKKLKPYLHNIIETYIEKLPDNVAFSYTYAKLNYSDQHYCIKEYVKNNSLIDLDYNCNVFQTLFSGNIHSAPYEKLIIDKKKKIFYNPVTKTYPLLVHGNGKTILDKVLDIV